MDNRGPRVIFIAGFGRSGSTLLEFLLSSSSNLLAVGELKNIWERGVRQNQLCSCEHPFRECPFWVEVFEQVFGGIERVPLNQILDWQNRTDRLRYTPAHLFSGLRSKRFREARRGYTQVLEQVISTAIRVSGTHALIDSSKDPSHGFLLAGSQALLVDVIHLVRDPRAVAFSWMRRRVRPEIHWQKHHMPRYSILHSMFGWNANNFLNELLRGRVRSYRWHRYEDLARDPASEMKRITEHLGISVDVGSGWDTIDPRKAFHHSVAGNPLRFRQESASIEPDIEWKEGMGSLAKAFVVCKTLPLIYHYGYSLLD